MRLVAKRLPVITKYKFYTLMPDVVRGLRVKIAKGRLKSISCSGIYVTSQLRIYLTANDYKPMIRQQPYYFLSMKIQRCNYLLILTLCFKYNNTCANL